MRALSVLYPENQHWRTICLAQRGQIYTARAFIPSLIQISICNAPEINIYYRILLRFCCVKLHLIWQGDVIHITQGKVTHEMTVPAAPAEYHQSQRGLPDREDGGGEEGNGRSPYRRCI